MGEGATAYGIITAATAALQEIYRSQAAKAALEEATRAAAREGITSLFRRVPTGSMQFPPLTTRGGGTGIPTSIPQFPPIEVPRWRGETRDIDALIRLLRR